MYRTGRSSRQAVRALSAQGIAVPEQPEAQFVGLPEDLTDLDEKDLMVLYTKTVAWSTYAASQLAMAAIDEKELERRLESLSLTAQLEARAAGSNVTDARLAAKDDQDVQELGDKVFEAEAYRKMLEVVVENYDKSSALISRELTRRTAGRDYRRRDGGVWGPA